MPSKKKKTKCKGRGVAKSRKELRKDSAGSDMKNDVTSQMQRLKINKSNQDDEGALLEEAINLAAAEREELDAAEVEKCDHGFVQMPNMHGFMQEESDCAEFTDSFMTQFMATDKSCISDRFLIVVEAMKFERFGVWNDPSVLQQKLIYLLAKGVHEIYGGEVNKARQSAMLASFMEQYKAAFLSKVRAQGFPSFQDFNMYNIMRGGTTIHKDDPAWKWGKISELANDDCDEHTIVSFFRKRVPCKCLDKKYKEVKSIVKMGLCGNPSCPLPNREVECSKLMYCSKCFTARFCSSKCQKAAWPLHKQHCEALDKIPVQSKFGIMIGDKPFVPSY